MEEALIDGVIGRRVAAWIIDAIIVGMIGAALHVALWLLGLLTFGLGWYFLGGLWVVPIAYIFLFVGSEQQATPGQAIMDLAVVRDDDLGRPTPAQALFYAAGFALTLALAGVLLLAALFTRRSRCLHDMVAGVAVLRASALPQRAAFTMAGGSFGR